MIKKKNKEEKEKEVKIEKTNLDIMPIRFYDKDVKAYRLNDGTYLDFVEIITKDIPNLIEDEIQRDMLMMAKFYKLFDESKLICMNFPTNTLHQRTFLLKKLEETNNPINKKWIRRSIHELELQDKHTMRREYYMMFWAENLAEYQRKVDSISSILGFGITGLARPLPAEKKHKIIYKLNNMNSLINVED